MAAIDKHFITKLRPDANLRYLFEGKHEQRKGPKKKSNSKIIITNFSAGDASVTCSLM